MMTDNLNHLKEEVQKLNYQEFLAGNVSLHALARTKTSRDMPIMMLDQIIQQEEETYQKGVYNRGDQLKTSLIDANKVKAFVQEQERIKSTQRMASRSIGSKVSRGGRGKSNGRLNTITTTKNDPEWTNMMEFFKQNPAALMDALPTPPGSDDGSQQQPEFVTSTNKSYMQKQDFDNKSIASIRSKRSNQSSRSKTFKSFVN